MNPARLHEVAAEQAGLVPERYPTYRADLIRCLVDVLAAQEEGLSDRGRRDKVSRVVEAFGAKVASQAGRG
ncbi:MAG: hypothetical protein AB7V46_25830 [Thermomicrobiales bacterium]